MQQKIAAFLFVAILMAFAFLQFGLWQTTSYAQLDPTAQTQLARIAATFSAGGLIPAGTVNAVWTPQERDFDGVKMVLVPAGCFMMGSDNGNDDERPVHEVCITQPFWLDKYEVSNEQFKSKGGNAYYLSYGEDTNAPRDSITWTESDDYCQLRGARLPTEAEWEYAARGPQSLVYPWGNDFVANNVTYYDNSGHKSAPVDSRPGGQSWVGAYNLSGNVWEWVADWYSKNYYSSSPKNNPTGPIFDQYRIWRGGAWTAGKHGVHSAARYWVDSYIVEYVTGGFRCARTESLMGPPTLTPTYDPNLISAGTSNALWTPQERNFDDVMMVLVPAGCFMMGTSDEKISVLKKQYNASDYIRNETPMHEVCITKPFWLDKYEVTQGQFRAKNGKAANESYFKGSQHPVEHVNWYEAVEYCNARGGSLPTEAQWEYAARGPEGREYPWGTWDRSKAVWAKLSNRQTAKVGSIPAGASWVGALDMIGNVEEWVGDWYAERYATTKEFDPVGLPQGKYRVTRGGSWLSVGMELRGASRNKNLPRKRDGTLGFRCTRTE